MSLGASRETTGWSYWGLHAEWRIEGLVLGIFQYPLEIERAGRTPNTEVLLVKEMGRCLLVIQVEKLANRTRNHPKQEPGLPSS